MIVRDTTSVLKGLVLRYSEVPCATLIFHDIFECRVHHQIRRQNQPNIWLEDYRLTCRAGGVTDDLFIIQFLPIYLAESARAWLDRLSRNTINCWDNLWEVFTGNFQGTYMHPGNP
jgi:hypothetical protein